MKLPRLRWTMRQMLIGVAAAAVLMIPLSEYSYRRHLQAYHAQQELLSEKRAMELFQEGRAAVTTGRSMEATESFAASDYWNEQATGHHRMQKIYERPLWTLSW
jgi:hypothetical protein